MPKTANVVTSRNSVNSGELTPREQEVYDLLVTTADNQREEQRQARRRGRLE